MRFRPGKWLVVLLLAGAPALALADDVTEQLQRLKQQIQDLQQKVSILERNKEIEAEATASRARQTPTVVAGTGGIVVSSADTNFVLKLRGYIQADSRFFLDDQVKGNDTFLLRRVRPVFEGAVYQNYEYKIMPDFGANTSSTANNTANNGMLQDAFINIHYCDEAQLMLGKFKAPVGLERLQSARNLVFVERSLPTQLVPNRDVGVDFHGTIRDGFLEYDLAAVNGAGDAGSDDIEAADDGKDLVGRLFLRPFRLTKVEALRGFGLGAAATVGNHEGTLTSYASAGQQRFFRWRTGAGGTNTPNVTASGEQYRFVPQLSYYWGAFGLNAEYVLSSQEVVAAAGARRANNRFENSAWQVSASYVLTGEQNSYDGINPRHPFTLNGGGWGAWEIAARLGQLSLDDRIFGPVPNGAGATWAAGGSAREANEWGIGLNWYLNRMVKLNVDYHCTQFEGGSNAKGSVTAHDEQVILTRVQVAF